MAAQTSMHDFSFEHYISMIRAFSDAGYTFVGYDGLDPSASHVVFRHDIDFSLDAALDIGEIEAIQGIQAYYFVLLRSEFYNLFSRAGMAFSERIQSLGHKIGLHFDAALYPDDPEQMQLAAARECEVLENFIDAPVDVISFHRPAKSLHGFAGTLAGRIHAYQPSFFSDIAYFSDSQGSFRFGQPLESDAFQRRSAMQVLTHPIWWSADGVEDRISLIDWFIEARLKVLKLESAANCLPYRNRIEKLYR